MAAQRAATAFAPSGPMPLLLRPNSWTLLTVLPRIASHSMRVPSSRKLFPPTKILVTDGQTAMPGANAAAPSGPNSLSLKSSCVQEQGNGSDEPNKQSGREAGKGAHEGVLMGWTPYRRQGRCDRKVLG